METKNYVRSSNMSRAIQYGIDVVDRVLLSEGVRVFSYREGNSR